MTKTRLNRISIVLDELGFSQKDLSEYLKVSKNTVSRWCRNVNQPDLDKIYGIAKFFRIKMERLIESPGWEEEVGPPPFQLFRQHKNEAKEKKKLPVRKKMK